MRNYREATSVVRRTLIGIAIFGALWYLLLLSRAEQNPAGVDRPAAVPAVEKGALPDDNTAN